MTTRSFLPDVSTLISNTSLLEPSINVNDNNKSIAFDWDQLDFCMEGGNFRFVSNVENIKQWVHHTLATEMRTYPVYGFGYGSEFPALLGRKVAPKVLETTIKYFIEQALLIHDQIRSISDMETSIIADQLYVQFQVVLVDNSTFEYNNEWVI